MAIVAGNQALAADVALGANMPSGSIIIWTGTIVNIPAGWLICDGNNSTPNLLTRFLEGVATAATNPGTTGGATNKTTDGHIHTQGVTGVPSATDTSDVNTGRSFGDATHTHTNPDVNTNTDTITDIRPLFYDVAFIMKS